MIVLCPAVGPVHWGWRRQRWALLALTPVKVSNDEPGENVSSEHGAPACDLVCKLIVALALHRGAQHHAYRALVPHI
jgi:hypothetical protein